MDTKKIAAPGEGAASKDSTNTIARFHQVSRAIRSDILDQRIRAVVRRRLGVVEAPPAIESRSSVVAAYLAMRRAEMAGGAR
jgi:hypothetical protein